MFDNLIVAYLFLGGTGAAACVVLCVLGLVLARSETAGIAHRRLFGFGYLMAAAACAIGAFCLLADLRRPDEVLVLVQSPSVSVVSVGAYVLAATMLLAVLSGLAWLGAFKASRTVVRVASAVHIALALAVMTYTALLLMMFRSVPFFGSPLIIALFLASSLSCGTAFVVVCAVVSRAWQCLASALRALVAADLAVIVVEALVLTAFMLVSVQEAPKSAERLLVGELSAPFWVGPVAGGLAAPLALYVAERFLPSARINPLLPALLVLAGGFALRWCVVAAA